jgi:coenzyme F420-reducing hydrogenase alpha subunit
VVRALELVHAFAEALDLVDAYVEPRQAFVREASAADATNARVGFGATEAPRGLLWHRYELDDEGLVRDARIVPPTSQNQARIEADLVAMAPALLALPHDEATALCERLIRSYDPCISCATHFLDLRIEGA